MKRALALAALLACSAAFADDPPADAPVIVVVKGTLTDDVGAVHQVEGGSYSPHEATVRNAQRFESLEWQNGALKVLLGLAVAAAVAVTVHDLSKH